MKTLVRTTTLFLLINLLFINLLSAQRILPYRVGSQWGTIDSTGKIIVNPQYNNVIASDNPNFIIALQNYRSGLLDAKGNLLINHSYDSINVLSNEFIVVWDKALAALYQNGKGIISPFKFFRLNYPVQDFFVLSDTSDNELFINTSRQLVYEKKFGLSGRPLINKSPVRLLVGSKTQKGIINELCEVIVPLEYMRLRPFIVKNQRDSVYFYAVRKKEAALFDLNGKLVVPLKYEQIDTFSNHLLIVKKDGLKGLITYKDQTVVPILFDTIKFMPNVGYLVKRKEFVGIYTLNSKELIQPVYSNIEVINQDFFSTQLLRKGQKVAFDFTLTTWNEQDYKSKFTFGVINQKGTEIIPAIYNQVTYLPRFNSFEVSSDEGVGMINSLGDIILTPKYPKENILIDSFKNVIRARNNEGLTIVTLDNNGTVNDRVLYTNVLSASKKKVLNVLKWRRLTIGGVDNGKGNLKAWGLFSNNTQIIECQFTAYNPGFNGKDYLVRTMKNYTEKMNDGFVIAGEYLSDSERLGLVNQKTGTVLLEPRYDMIYESDFKKAGVARCVYYQRSDSRRGNVYRLINGEGKILNYRYLFVGEHQNGYATVFREGWGVIDSLGKETIKAVHSYLGAPLFGKRIAAVFGQDKYFNENMNRIFSGAKVGVITNSGKTIIPFKYDFLAYFSSTMDSLKLWRVCPLYKAKIKNLWGAIDSTGKIVIPLKFLQIRLLRLNDKNYFAVQNKNSFWGVLSEKQDTIVPFTFNDIDIIKTNQTDYFRVIDKRKHFGYIKDTINEVVEPIFHDGDDFYCGFARVLTEKGYWTFINRNADLMQDARYDRVSNFVNNYASVLLNGYWGIIDTLGNKIVPIEYVRVGEFSEGKTWLQAKKKYKFFGLFPTKNNTFFIDSTGRKLFDKKFSHVENFHKNYAIAKNKKRTGMIDTSGNWVIKPKFDDVSQLDDYGFAVITEGKFKGVVNKNGSLVVKPEIYKEIRSFREGLAAVEHRSQWGYIDTTGNEVIKAAYTAVFDFKEGRARVKKGTVWYIIDSTGNEIAQKLKNCTDFKNGVCAVTDSKSNNYFINRKGEKIANQISDSTENKTVEISQKIPSNSLEQFNYQFPYIKIYPFVQQRARVEINSLYGIYDCAGNQIIKAEYTKVASYKNSYLLLEKIKHTEYLKEEAGKLRKMDIKY